MLWMHADISSKSTQWGTSSSDCWSNIWNGGVHSWSQFTAIFRKKVWMKHPVKQPPKWPQNDLKMPTVIPPNMSQVMKVPMKQPGISQMAENGLWAQSESAESWQGINLWLCTGSNLYIWNEVATGPCTATCSPLPQSDALITQHLYKPM